CGCPCLLCPAPPASYTVSLRDALPILPAEARTRSSPGGGIYSEDAGVRTYAHLAELAARVVASAYPVLVDATFLKGEQRRRFRRSEEHTSELQSRENLVCRLLLEKENG